MPANVGPSEPPHGLSHAPGEEDQSELITPTPPPAGPSQGIPADWLGYEQTHLAAGAWHFYRLAAQVHQTSIKEDNWVVRAGTPMLDAAGLEAFLREMDLLSNPRAVAPELLAEQVGMFLIRGNSRRSCAVNVIGELPPDANSELAEFAGRIHPPQVRVRAGSLTFRAWYLLGEHPEQVSLTLPRAGKLQLKWS